MWLPDVRYLQTPSSLIASGSQADRPNRHKVSFAIIKPCYTQKLCLCTSSLSAPAKPPPASASSTELQQPNPSPLACRRWRGSVKYGADQVPMTCIHDCHLHAATLIRRTYMEFGDATGCSISNPLSLGSPEARPRGYARTIVARLDIWHRNTQTKRFNRSRGVGQIKIGMLPHTAL